MGEVVLLLRGDIVEVNLSGAEGRETKSDLRIDARLCLVIQNDKGNAVSPMTIVVPITSHKGDRERDFHVFLNTPLRQGPLSQASVIHCEQVRTVDRNFRVRRVIGALSALVMNEVDAALRISLGLTSVQLPRTILAEDTEQM